MMRKGMSKILVISANISDAGLLRFHQITRCGWPDAYKRLTVIDRFRRNLMANFLKYTISNVDIESRIPPSEVIPLLPTLDRLAFKQLTEASLEESAHSIDGINSEADGKWYETKGNSWNVYCYDSSGPVRCRDGAKELWGSGAAIGPNLVLTAGHVVHSGRGGAPFGPIWFIPAFPHKVRLYYASHVYVSPGWANSGKFTDDVAILVLQEKMDIAGYSGIVADLPLHRDPRVEGKFLSWFTLAYPAKTPFAGNKQIMDIGPPSDWAFREGTLYFQAELEAMKGFDLTPGASGGPWFISRAKLPYRRVWKGYAPTHGAPGPYDINGVNSFTRSDKPGVIYSPHFGGRVTAFIVDALADIVASGLASGGVTST